MGTSKACGLALALALLAGCAESGDFGGITADIVWGDEAPARRALRAAAPPSEVGRLVISALDVAGSTLATTALALEPGPGELPLLPQGGDWSLEAVPVGANRSVLAKAFFRESFRPGAGEIVAFTGRIDNVEVRAGLASNVGVLRLQKTPNRLPEADETPPAAPSPVTATPLPSGERVRVTFTPPDDDDLVGFLLAIATSTAANLAPPLERGARYTPGDQLASGVRVHALLPRASEAQSVDVEGLVDAVPVGVLVYAFDGDANDAPLNYSTPGQALAVPSDTLPPAAPGGLAARAVGTDQVRIELVTPGEDGAEGGPPALFELRAAGDRATLEAQFDALPAVEPPPVGAVGETVAVERSFGQLGGAPAAPLFVGLRAVDAAANPGPIAIAEVVQNATVAPTLARLEPPIGLAGRELVITGDGFGTVTGTVTLEPSETGTVTVTLNVTRWTNGQIIAGLPTRARTGRLVVIRPDGARVDAPLSVVARVPYQVSEQVYPFEVVGTGRDNPVAFAVYREEGDFGTYDSAIDRFYGEAAEGTPWAPAIEDQRSTTIAGTYSPRLDRFLFVASDQALSMTSALVTSSTVTPDPFRQAIGVTAGRADRVSVVITEGGLPGEVPAMVAFTLDGALRTATVADARFQPFDGFYATTSTVEAYDAVTLARDADGAVLMAHRTITGTVAVLTLRDNPGGIAPNAFTTRPISNPPRVGERFELLSVPQTPGGPERFLVAYEHPQPDGGRRVRLLWADEVGARLGLAPLGPGDRRLDDVGLVLREGEVYVAIVSAQLAGSSELTYTEVPISAISDPTAPDGAWPGVIVDIAREDHYARVGCKPFLQAHCPIFWSGDVQGVLFMRR